MSVKENPKRFWTFVRAKFAKPGIPKFINFYNAFASTPVDKAKLFNAYFLVFSVLTATDNVYSKDDCANSYSHLSLTNITLSENEVLNCLRSINVSKASGPYGIPGRLLKAVATEITPSLTKLFNLSLSSEKVPSAWKIALITPILKNGDPHVMTNYRPISLLPILSKVLDVYTVIAMSLYNTNYLSINMVSFKEEIE